MYQNNTKIPQFNMNSKDVFLFPSEDKLMFETESSRP